MSEKKKASLQHILALQGIVAIYTLASAMGKFASGHEFLSWGFILFYGAEIGFLGVYALLWQQAIKRFDLSVAYANRSVALLWLTLWNMVLFRQYEISPNQIAGMAIVIIGTMVVNSDE